MDFCVRFNISLLKALGDVFDIRVQSKRTTSFQSAFPVYHTNSETSTRHTFKIEKCIIELSINKPKNCNLISVRFIGFYNACLRLYFNV